MIRYEDECVGCPKDMGCLGKYCPNRNVLHMYCDHCGEEVDELREYNGEQWCEDCIIEQFDIVDIE